MMESVEDFYKSAAFILLGIVIGGACGTTFPESTHGGVVHQHCWKKIPLEEP